MTLIIFIGRELLHTFCDLLLEDKRTKAGRQRTNFSVYVNVSVVINDEVI